MNTEKNAVTPGLSQRVMREIIETPALKEVMLLQMKGIKPEAADGLAETLLWGDPGISMSFFGAVPDIANWLLEFLLELGRQFNGIPEPLLKEILGRIAAGVDRERLGQFPAVYGQLARRLLIGEGKTPEEVRAAVAGAINSALAGMDRLTLKLEENRDEIAGSLAIGLKEMDTAVLRRALRRAVRLALATARASGGRFGGKAGRAGRERMEEETMTGEAGYLEKKKRWQRFMYGYNTVMCLSLGPPMVVFQKLPKALLKWPYEDPVMMGIYGSIVTSVGTLSAAALSDEANYERFLPVFYSQLMYKSITCALLARQLRRREVPSWGLWVLFWFFVVYIVMLVKAIPWRKPAGVKEIEG